MKNYILFAHHKQRFSNEYSSANMNIFLGVLLLLLRLCKTSEYLLA